MADARGLCSAINVTNENLGIQLSQETIWQLILIIIPSIISVLSQLALLLASLFCNDGNIISSFHVFFQNTAWIFIAVLVQVNRRVVSFLNVHSKLGSEILCKAQGFAGIFTQSLAIWSLLMSAIGIRISGLKESNRATFTIHKEAPQKWSTFGIFALSWFTSIIFGIGVAFLYHAECIILRDITVDERDDRVTLCLLESPSIRIVYSYTRLILFAIAPTLLLIVRIGILLLKRKRPDISQRMFPQHNGPSPGYMYHTLQIPSIPQGIPNISPFEYQRQCMLKKRQKRKEACHFLLPIALIFFLTWTPIHSLKLLQSIQASTFYSFLYNTTQLEHTTNRSNVEWFNNLHDNHTYYLTFLCDMLEPYFFSLWLMYPALQAILSFIVSKQIRKCCLDRCRK